MSDLKTLVRDKYAAIATGSGNVSCCGSGCGEEIAMIGDEYENVEGYVPEADLRLGCGLPTELARIRPGQTVLDLGSGAGLDAFVARSLVGEAGRVIGVDMTPEMVEKARRNARQLGFENVSFLLGDVEALPLEAESVDVVISNCVLNLVPDKPRAFAEMYRVLKSGGHFCVSDIVVNGALPERVRQSAELYAGCVSGAMEREAYLEALRGAGFTDVEVVQGKVVDVPDEAMRALVSPAEIEAFRRSGGALLSVTVYGVKE